MNASTKKDIAFFDIDYTVLSINSGEALIKQAYSNGVINAIGLLKAAYTGLQYKYALKDSKKIIQKMGSWLAGISEEKFKKLSQEIFQKDLLPNIRPNIIKEINQLKKAGTEVVILSSSIRSVCIPLGKHLDADAVICTELEVEDGVFTGKPVGEFCFRDEKLVQLKKFCKNRNVSLENTAYYADSIDDLPALLQVGFPVCISPDRKLNKIAFENGWRVQNW